MADHVCGLPATVDYSPGRSKWPNYQFVGERFAVLVDTSDGRDFDIVAFPRQMEWFWRHLIMYLYYTCYHQRKKRGLYLIIDALFLHHNIKQSSTRTLHLRMDMRLDI